MKNIQEIFEAEVKSAVDAQVEEKMSSIRTAAQKLAQASESLSEAARNLLTVVGVAVVATVATAAEAFSYTGGKVQACLRGSTIHFQKGALRSYTRGDIHNAPKDALGLVGAALEKGDKVGTSFYGSQTRYVEVTPISATLGKLPNGETISLPSGLI